MSSGGGGELGVIEITLICAALVLILLQTAYLLVRICVRRAKDAREEAARRRAEEVRRTTPPANTPTTNTVLTIEGSLDTTVGFPVTTPMHHVSIRTLRASMDANGTPVPRDPFGITSRQPSTDSLATRASTDLMDGDEMRGAMMGGIHNQNPNRITGH